MMRWTLLAFCFVLGACKTVTPLTRTDVPATGGDSRPAATVNPEGLAELAPPLPAESVALPTLPSAQHGDVTIAGSLPLPVSSPARQGATKTTAALSAPLPLRESTLPKQQLAGTLALPFLDKASTNKPEGGTPRREAALVIREGTRPPVPGNSPVIELEGGVPRRQTGLAALAPPPIAIPSLPATRHGEATASGTLPLLASSSVRLGDTNTAARLPVTIPSWVADTQMEKAWRESELNRQTRTQQEREEQFQQFHRAFYQFLSVKPGE